MTTQPDTERYVIGRNGVFATLYDRQEKRLVVESATENHCRRMRDQLLAAEVRAAALTEAAAALADLIADGEHDPDSLVYELRHMAAAARPETEAQPARHRWAVETRDPDADEWVPGHRFLQRHHAADRLAALAENHPTWRDGTPAQRRLTRETTTYTVEQPPAAARPDDTTPRAARMVCGICETSVGWIDCPTGGWWAHADHPQDGHDAQPRPDDTTGDA